ncbi:hypothetical protein [Microbacterium sp. NIBRBAC000506063]|uniref:hypothetical protein n=1 Tax=Microbacterium sp. NIBRBAC000506063 TaxID=2734618 RepID=UPI001CB724DE|nr:hypothetical protein [Microbacterium sp. NIBRBAC000506063]
MSGRAAVAAGKDVSHRWAEVLEETRAAQEAEAAALSDAADAPPEPDPSTPTPNPSTPELDPTVPELVEGPDTPADSGRVDGLSDRGALGDAEGKPPA